MHFRRFFGVKTTPSLTIKKLQTDEMAPSTYKMGSLSDLRHQSSKSYETDDCRQLASQNGN